MARKAKIAEEKQEHLSVEFKIDREKLKVAQYAIDLPNDEYGVQIDIDCLKDFKGFVMQDNDVVGECVAIDEEIFNLYDKCCFTVMLNITRTDFTVDLRFKTGVHSIYQLPDNRLAGLIQASDVRLKRGFRTSLAYAEDHRRTALVGKELDNKDDLFERIKNMVYSKF